jgi:hypothetical protein
LVSIKGLLRSKKNSTHGHRRKEEEEDQQDQRQDPNEKLPSRIEQGPYTPTIGRKENAKKTNND